MKILALDISTKCTGWAYLHAVSGDKRWTYGSIVSPSYYSGLTKNDLLMGQALLWFVKEINKLAKEFEPDIVCAEGINIRHATTMRTIAQFHAAASIGISLWNKEKVLTKIHNATLRSLLEFPAKKFVPKEIVIKSKKEKVDITKVLMVDKVKELFDINLNYKDHDIADAIGLAWVCKLKN